MTGFPGENDGLSRDLHCFAMKINKLSGDRDRLAIDKMTSCLRIATVLYRKSTARQRIMIALQRTNNRELSFTQSNMICQSITTTITRQLRRREHVMAETAADSFLMVCGRRPTAKLDGLTSRWRNPTSWMASMPLQKKQYYQSPFFSLTKKKQY
jgi:hypothetical protein